MGIFCSLLSSSSTRSLHDSLAHRLLSPFISHHSYVGGKLKGLRDVERQRLRELLGKPWFAERDGNALVMDGICWCSFCMLGAAQPCASEEPFGCAD